MKKFVTFSVMCFVLVSAQSLPTLDSYKRRYRNYYPTSNRNTRQWSGVRYHSTNDYLNPPLYTNGYSYFSRATNPLIIEALYRGLSDYEGLSYGDLGYGNLRYGDLGYRGLGGYIGLRGLGIGGLQGYAGLYGIQGPAGHYRNYGDLRAAYEGPESLYRRLYAIYGLQGLRSLYNRVGGLGIRGLYAPADMSLKTYDGIPILCN